MTKLVRSPFWWENFWPCFPSILSHCRPVCPQLVLSYIWSLHQELDKKKNISWQTPNEMLIWMQKTFGPVSFTFSQWFDLSVINFLKGIIHPRMKCDMPYIASVLRVHCKCFCDQRSLGSLPLLPFGLLSWGHLIFDNIFDMIAQTLLEENWGPFFVRPTQLAGFDCWRFCLILDWLVLRSSYQSCCYNRSVSLNLLGSRLISCK